MKEIILEIIKEYFKLKMTAKEVNISNDGKDKQIRIKTTRASVSYELNDDRGKPDDLATIKFQEMERQRLAQQLFDITTDILISHSKYDDYKEKDDRRTFTTHQEMMSWSLRNLIREKIISPYEYIDQEETLDEEGDLIGYTRMAKKKDEVEELLEE